MEEFEIKGDNGFLRLTIDGMSGYPDKLSELGGYDMYCSILVKSADYEVKTRIWMQTTDIYHFYQQTSKCQKELKGSANINTIENIFELKLVYDAIGHCEIVGSVGAFGNNDYELKFELRSDQSYISDTLRQMKPIVDKYGDRTGMTRLADLSTFQKLTNLNHYPAR